MRKNFKGHVKKLSFSREEKQKSFSIYGLQQKQPMREIDRSNPIGTKKKEKNKLSSIYKKKKYIKIYYENLK